MLTRSGTTLQVWYNNPDQKKTESLYKKVQKLVNSDTYLMIDQYIVGKPFPSTLDDTHKYGIGINSGTALRVFDVIKQPVNGSCHTKMEVNFGSSFEVAKDQKRAVKKRKEKLFDEKKRAVDQATLIVIVKANPVPNEIEAEVSDNEVVDPLLEAELLTKTPSDDDDGHEETGSGSMGTEHSEPSENTSSHDDSMPEYSHESGNESTVQPIKCVKRNMQP